MRSVISTAIITLVVIASGLYAGEEDTSQQEPGIKLELIWERDIPEGVHDVIFLDKNGYNVFSVQCEDPEGALREKRILMVEGDRLRYY
ncbi:hypothetical protein DRN58_08675, partial [Thermococci archaeon]